MATVAELIQNVEKIRNFVGVYLAVENPTKKQRDALAIDLGQLDRNLAALVAAMKAPVAVVPPTPVPVGSLSAEVEKPPFYGESNAMSTGLYSDWVSEWVQKTFPEAYRDWPPTVYAVDPAALVSAATAAGCLAQVCAAGTLGDPAGPYSADGDWSLYTALTSTSDEGGWRHRIWLMGTLIGEKVGGPNDGLEWANNLTGFNW